MSPDKNVWPRIKMRWWRGYLGKGCGVQKDEQSLSSNIGYSLQYIEYLNHLCLEPDLHVTVRAMTYRSFVIHSMSVMEAIAFCLLKKRGKDKSLDWVKVETWEAPGKNLNFLDDGTQSSFRTVVTLEKKQNVPVTVQMNMKQIFHRLEQSKLIVGIKEEDYRKLSYLRRLRNKIHIYEVSKYSETDWNSFQERHYRIAKRMLGLFLTSEQFDPTSTDKRKLSWLLNDDKGMPPLF